MGLYFCGVMTRYPLGYLKTSALLLPVAIYVPGSNAISFMSIESLDYTRLYWNMKYFMVKIKSLR